MKYAVVLSGGKQYRVAEGETVAVEKLGLNPNDTYTFEEVLLFVDGDKKKVGAPRVSGVKVVGTVVAEKKTRKVRVAKFKAKAKYRRVTGSRKVLTHITVNAISAGNE